MAASEIHGLRKELTLRIQHNQYAINGAFQTIQEILQTEQTADMNCVPDILKRLNQAYHRFPYNGEDERLLHDNVDINSLNVSLQPSSKPSYY